MSDNEYYTVEYVSCSPDGLAGGSTVLCKTHTRPSAAGYASQIDNMAYDSIIVRDQNQSVIDRYPQN